MLLVEAIETTYWHRSYLALLTCKFHKLLRDKRARFTLDRRGINLKHAL